MFGMFGTQTSQTRQVKERLASTSEPMQVTKWHATPVANKNLSDLVEKSNSVISVFVVSVCDAFEFYEHNGYTRPSMSSLRTIGIVQRY